MKKPLRFPGRQPVSPEARDQFDPSVYSRRAFELAAERTAAFRAAATRVREPRDRPKTAEAVT